MPSATFRELRTLWFQLTGTRCNLTCRHCLNASGPRAPWLADLEAGEVRRHLGEAAALGVKEIYVTGGEPFLHPELFALLEEALAVAPATVLTNGTLIDDVAADRLAAIAAGSPYSLEIRVSIDGTTAKDNDGVRGRGSFARALGAIRRLDARALHPIVTLTEIAGPAGSGAVYERARELLAALGLRKIRVKVLPLFAMGRWRGDDAPRLLTEELLAGFDTATLQCTEARVVAAGGIYVCPILAGLPAGRVEAHSLAEAITPVSLGHPACFTCYETGMSCRNS